MNKNGETLNLFKNRSKDRINFWKERTQYCQITIKSSYSLLS